MELKDFKKENYIDFYEEVDTIPCSPTTDNGSEWYGYITKQGLDLNEILDAIEIPDNPKIVDLGSGYCENLLYLSSYFGSQDNHAVEMNTTYNEYMTTAIPQYNLPITLHEENFLEHDISTYDVVYSFSPAMTTENYAAYTDYVLENMKVGAIWVEVLSHEPNPIEWDTKETVQKAISRYGGVVDVLYEDGTVIVLQKT